MTRLGAEETNATNAPVRGNDWRQIIRSSSCGITSIILRDQSGYISDSITKINLWSGNACCAWSQ